MTIYIFFSLSKAIKSGLLCQINAVVCPKLKTLLSFNEHIRPLNVKLLNIEQLNTEIRH